MSGYREIQEMQEEQLSQWAARSVNSMGRDKYEEPCPIRTCYQRDRDRIIHSKSFRRLKHKTQVFIAPTGDHYRTRLTHTLEVNQVARTMGRALRLNEDLIEAIALGHDLGHTPFGHGGEAILNKLNPNGFHHNQQSVRVVELLESRHKDRPGLNLTKEVREGILNHTGDATSITLEGQLIKFADRIAYINHDIDDAIRAGVLTGEDIPSHLVAVLGNSHSARINTMILDVIENSVGMDRLKMSATIGNAMMELRQFMFKKVYLNSTAKSEDEKIEILLTNLYEYFIANMESLPEDHLEIYKDRDDSKEDIVCDYIAGMTDHYAITVWKEMFVPKSWNIG
ncbi:MAG: deoxyguanosinetriphosphate triphosphohydrolase [Tissierellia bacterium]|nr:deoxyguanosinetriphosphate triphosphohydrolase [Tissierellia bacterium]